MSKAYAPLAITSALLLCGCFTSDEPILKGGGDRLTLKSETYACAATGEPLKPAYIKEADKGGGKYAFLVSDEKNSASPYEYTFHHVRGHRYIVTWFERGHTSPQLIAMAYIDGSSLIGVKPDKEQAAQVAQKHNVKLDDLALTGDLAAKQAFLDDLARTWAGAEVAFACVGLPD
jgi:hypothetical protein